jgi:tripeptide aminopeptidase
MSLMRPAEIRDKLKEAQEVILSNILMIGEIPSPSGLESARMSFLADRFRESFLQDISVDEEGNIQALIPGRIGKRTILVSAHADTLVSLRPDERLTVSVSPEALHGPGLADNSIGAAALAALPDLLKFLGLQLDSNILLLGHVKSLGSKDLAGLRFFLNNYPRPLDAGIVLEGITLGRLNHTCLGMVQADIHCRVHQEPGKRWEASENAIVIMHRIIRHILEIPIPQEPRTSVILGSLHSGKTFNRPPETARLRLEIRSEEPGKAREIRMCIKEMLDEISAETASECSITFPALRQPGGIPFSHPFITAAREVMTELDVKPRLGPSYSDLSILISKKIPALTLGLTTARNLNEAEERVLIEPLFSGLAQLIALLQRMDALIPSEPPTEN